MLPSKRRSWVHPPAFGSTASYQLRYGYQQIDNTDSNYVGIRWNGSAYNGNQNGIGFVELQNIKDRVGKVGVSPGTAPL